ncbi:MAG: glycosyltransferase [Roseburia sp.]|nr:glycosyltransferase [Roseburia sp.]MCM1278809.1 glycosyltransferase [Robinsoniella sp.]
MKISVIIPMYNGSASIGKCLGNLSRQDFTEKYEVLIVDDASTDGSAGKVKQMITAFPNQDIFHLIECETNGRAGNARNIGISQAKGEYVLFIDQDDYPDETMLSKLWELSKEGKVDCVSCNIGDKGGIPYHRVFLGYKENLSREDRIALMKGHGYVFAMLLRRSILLDNHLYFPVKLMFEDCLYNIGIFSCIRSFCNTEEELYYRETDENSQTATITQKKLSDRIASTKWYLKNFENNEMVQEFHKELYEEAFYYIYLSCVWWMITDKTIYDEKMIRQSIHDARSMKVDWKNVFSNEKRFRKLRLRILKYIYFHPKSYKRISKLLLWAKGCKNKLKGKK